MREIDTELWVLLAATQDPGSVGSVTPRHHPSAWTHVKAADYRWQIPRVPASGRKCAQRKDHEQRPWSRVLSIKERHDKYLAHCAYFPFLNASWWSAETSRDQWLRTMPWLSGAGAANVRRGVLSWATCSTLPSGKREKAKLKSNYSSPLLFGDVES